jgi:phosphoglycolate phosphatase-like HAD superfamily hydrolase
MKKYSTDTGLSALHGYQEWVFDLDGTIYEERDYLFPAYREMASFCAQRGLADECKVYGFLTHTFEQAGRKQLFDTLFETFEIPEEYLRDFLRILRTTSMPGTIKPFPYFQDILQIPKPARGRLSIITNGNVRQQKNKVRLIDWSGQYDALTVIYANQFEPKPSRASFDYWSSAAARGNAIYIGNEATDRAFAENSGMDFLQVEELATSVSS